MGNSGNEDLGGGVIGKISTRGQQKLHIFGDLSELITGLQFSSTLIFDSGAKDLKQNIAFNYLANHNLNSTLKVEIGDGAMELTAMAKSQINNEISVSGGISYLTANSWFNYANLGVFYNPSSWLEYVLIYTKHFDQEAKTGISQNLNFMNGIFTFKGLYFVSKWITMGINYELDQETETAHLNWGIGYKPCDTTEMKMKINSEGEVEAVIQADYNKNIALSMSSKFNAKSFKSYSEADFGIGIHATI